MPGIKSMWLFQYLGGGSVVPGQVPSRFQLATSPSPPWLWHLHWDTWYHTSLGKIYLKKRFACIWMKLQIITWWEDLGQSAQITRWQVLLEVLVKNFILAWNSEQHHPNHKYWISPRHLREVLREVRRQWRRRCEAPRGGWWSGPAVPAGSRSTQTHSTPRGRCHCLWSIPAE